LTQRQFWLRVAINRSHLSAPSPVLCIGQVACACNLFMASSRSSQNTRPCQDRQSTASESDRPRRRRGSGRVDDGRRAEASSSENALHQGVLQVGSAVKVFSRTLETWFHGEVAQVMMGSVIRVEFKADGNRYRKTVHLQSEHLGRLSAVAHDCPKQMGPVAPEVQRPFHGCRRALPAECGGDPEKYYIEMDYIWTLLEREHIVLIKGSWLLERWWAMPFEPLPSRRDLPIEARVDVQQLQKVVADAARVKGQRDAQGLQFILAISHCWLNPNHPDPEGFLLDQLARVIQAYLQSIKFLGLSHRLESLETFDGAFFFAWCSLDQPYHKRLDDGTYVRRNEYQLTSPQAESHAKALENMDIWYTHARTEVWMLTKEIDGQVHGYQERGWTTWEQTIANIISSESSVLDLGLLQDPDTSDDGEWMYDIRQICRSSRRPPISVETFTGIIEAKHFTCGAADLAIIKENYARNIHHAVSCVPEISLTDASLSFWDAEDIASFHKFLQHCKNLRRLLIQSFSLSVCAVCELAESLQHCKNLQSVELKHTQICDAGACALATGLRVGSGQSLRSLKLSHNRIGDAGARGLADGLQHCKNFEHLDLCFNQIGDAGACGLDLGIQHCESLQRLELFRNQIGDAGACGLADGLQHCKNFQALVLDSNPIGDVGACGLALGLQHCESLQRLELVGNQIGDAGACGLATGLQHCKHLQALALQFNPIGDAGARGLANGVQRCENLLELLLTGNTFGDPGACGLARGLQHCKNLKTLVLKEELITDAGVCELASGLRSCGNLRKLWLGMQIGDDGACGIADGLQQCTQIEELELSGKISDVGACGLSNFLRHRKALVKLYLPSHQIGDAGACGLAAGLQHCERLESFLLSGNQIGDAGACGLGDGLQRCANLKFIDFNENQICDIGASRLAAGLQHCVQLEAVCLSGNRIGDAGACALADGLRHCTNLESLTLGQNQIGDAGAWELADRLQQCQYLLRLDLTQNPVGDACSRSLANTPFVTVGDGYLSP